MTGEFKRKLDLAANASIDVVALNNQVVKMRPIVKRSKLYVIHKLTKNIKKLRGKKATEEQKKRNTSRANNLVEEVKVIKVLRPDYISKYALGTTETFEKLICQPNLDMERRALARLAEHQFIQDFVKKFRAEHADWKELTAYLMTKHTSREFKKKKPTQKLAKVATNVKATEKIVESYLGDKLKNTDTEIDASHDGNKVKLKGERAPKAEKSEDQFAKRRTLLFANQSSDFNTAGKAGEGDSDESDNQSDSQEDVESDSDEQNNDRLKINREVIKKVRNNKTNTALHKGNDSDNNSDSDSNDGTDDNDDDSSDSNEESSEHGQSDSDDSPNQPVLECRTSSSESEFDSEPNNFSKSDKDSKQKSVQTQVSKENTEASAEKLKLKSKGNKKVEKLKQKSSRTKTTDQVPSEESKSFIEKTSGEMIVKKINLEEWTEDSIDAETSKTVPEFLLETARAKTKRKTKDPFFATNDDSDFDSDDNKTGDINSGNVDSIENADNEFGEESEQFTGIRGLSTTFVGSLKSDRMMKCDDPQYRSNEDWKKKRHEMKARNFSEHRGRGGFDRPRGRGQFIKSRGGARGSRGQGQQMRSRGDSRGHRGGFRSQGRGHHGQQDSQSKRDYDSPSFKPVPNSTGSKSPEEKLLRPSWLKQGTMAASNKSEEKLHPSWQASKKRKEQQTSIQTFQGKKIKFDD